jgi:hypothetical protein
MVTAYTEESRGQYGTDVIGQQTDNETWSSLFTSFLGRSAQRRTPHRNLGPIAAQHARTVHHRSTHTHFSQTLGPTLAMPSKNQISNGLTYVAQTPSFLRNFGKPASPPRTARGEGRGDALPERPSEGKWARGSNDGDASEEEDEWEARFGGGGDEGPQVVVLREGRHLTEEQVKRERRRGECDV